MNVQRKVIYEQRRARARGRGLSEEIKQNWLPEVIEGVVDEYTASEVEGEWDSASSSSRWRRSTAPASAPRSSRASTARRSSRSSSTTRATPTASARSEIEGIQEGLMRDLERFIVLQVVDVRWREHLENMDYMREGIHLRGMAQKDPLVEYRNEGHMMFQELNAIIQRRSHRAALPRSGRRRPTTSGNPLPQQQQLEWRAR